MDRFLETMIIFWFIKYFIHSSSFQFYNYFHSLLWIKRQNNTSSFDRYSAINTESNLCNNREKKNVANVMKLHTYSKVPACPGHRKEPEANTPGITQCI